MPTLKFEDTIAAVATPPGEGGIAVIRVSGPQSIAIISQVFRSSKKINLEKQPTHTLHHGCLVDETGKPVDEVLIHLFRAPHSYTGEEVIEISCHGSMRLTRQILELLIHRGARHAEPGEFTKRAFLHGKIDLTQAEAVLDLIRARSDLSLETAMRQLQGSLSSKIHQLKESLMKIYAHLEAHLDFPDEHLETFSSSEILGRMEKLEKEMSALIASFRRGAALREGILAVIVGRPNVGKSSLLNALLAKDRALVSSLPGTTRDALEETLEIGGWAIRLVDTAGLAFDPKDPLDEMGIERTKRYLEEGDFFIFLMDSSSEWTPEDEAILSLLQGKKFLPVMNKVDLPQKLNPKLFQEEPCRISCLAGDGIPHLEKRLEEKMNQMEIVQESLTLTRLRHKQALEQALTSLKESKKTLQEQTSVEFVLEDLKASLDALREFIGEIYSEDLLDVIFQEFCIGK